MLIKPDLSEVKEDVGPGSYTAVVKGAEVKEWPNGGQYVNWTLETVNESETKNNGRRIFIKTATGGKGVFMLQRFYKAATGEALPTTGFDTDMLLGRKIAVDLHERNGYIEPKSFRTPTV